MGPPSISFGASSSPRSPTASQIRAFGLPLRSKAATEPVEPDLVLPSPPPPLRDGVTEVHYSRWVVEEANKDVGDQTREEVSAQKLFRKNQQAKFLVDQHRKVEDSHHQMASASAAVETVRLKKLELGQGMRVQLTELKQVIHAEKQVWSAKGRELVEHAKHVQSTKVLERQLSHRGQRQQNCAHTKKERERLTSVREKEKSQDEERKKGQVGRVRAETAKDTVGLSREKINAEKASVGQHCRAVIEANAAARQAARERFAIATAESRKSVEGIKSGAKSAREGLHSARRQGADEVRALRQQELRRKKELAEAVSVQNKQLHDLLYANKFAPRQRAVRVSLPGRIGKTAFNAFDADAAALDAAANAPAGTDAAVFLAAGGGGSMGGGGGSPGPFGSGLGGGRRASLGGGSGREDEWDG